MLDGEDLIFTLSTTFYLNKYIFFMFYNIY